jgi:hypothetical protein
MNTTHGIRNAGLKSSDARYVRSYGLLMALWGLCFMAAHLLLPRGEKIMANQPAWGWLLTIVTIVLGGLLAWSFVRFLRHADELMRKIQMEALAIGFGVAFVVGTSAGLLAQLGVPKVGVVDLTWSAMVVAYTLALRHARKAYSE